MKTVETQFFDLATVERPFYLQSGVAVGPARLAYEMYGDLNARRDNAILVFHALSGSQHAAGLNPSGRMSAACGRRKCRWAGGTTSSARGWGWTPIASASSA
jgi:homoserine acetyltransferase